MSKIYPRFSVLDEIGTVFHGNCHFLFDAADNVIDLMTREGQAGREYQDLNRVSIYLQTAAYALSPNYSHVVGDDPETAKKYLLMAVDATERIELKRDILKLIPACGFPCPAHTVINRITYGENCGLEISGKTFCLICGHEIEKEVANENSVSLATELTI